MGKNTKVQYGYCDYCEKEVSNPIKRSLDELEKTIWAILFISTLGVSFIVTFALIIAMSPQAIIACLVTFGATIVLWAFDRYVIRRKRFCPDCVSKLIYSDQPFDKPKDDSEPKSTKEKVLKKVEKKKKAKAKKPIPKPVEEEIEEVDDRIFCPFCGHVLKAEIATCPFCGTAIKY